MEVGRKRLSLLDDLLCDLLRFVIETCVPEGTRLDNEGAHLVGDGGGLLDLVQLLFRPRHALGNELRVFLRRSSVTPSGERIESRARVSDRLCCAWRGDDERGQYPDERGERRP